MIKEMDMTTCQRCGAIDIGRESCMEDLYTTVICMGCSNDWVSFILQHAITLQMKNVYTKMEFLTAEVTHSGVDRRLLDEHLILNDELLHLKLSLIEIIKEWVRGND